MNTEETSFTINYIDSQFTVSPIIPPDTDALYCIDLGGKTLVIYKDESEKWMKNESLSSKDIPADDDQPAAFGELIKNHYNL